MYTDQELDEIAQDHVRGAYGQRVVAEPQCDVEDPPGRYFSLEIGTAKDHHGLRGEGIVGHAGLFVDRRSGEITHFDPGHCMAATKKLKETRGTIDWERDRPALVRYMYIEARGA